LEYIQVVSPRLIFFIEGDGCWFSPIIHQQFGIYCIKSIFIIWGSSFKTTLGRKKERRSRTQDRRMKILIQEITPERITDVTAHQTITTTKSRNYCTRNHQINETLLQKSQKYSKQNDLQYS
jgi:hypothetical protein